MPKSQAPIDHLISIGEAAQVASVSTKTVRRMIARGEISAVRFGPRSVRIRVSDLQSAMRPIPTTAQAS